MNELIKELAEQSTSELQSYSYRFGNTSETYFNKEKFAELIIRECLAKIENEAAQYAEPVWAVELVNDIKDHFGVKG